MFSTRTGLYTRNLPTNPRLMGYSIVENKKSFPERLVQFINAKERSMADFCRKIKIPQNSLHHYVNDGREPKLTFFEKIKTVYPDANLSWLIVGTGEMLDKTSEYVVELENNLNIVSEKAELYKRIVEEKDKNEKLQKGNEPS